ncbi:hypothetical protein SCHPADRAFT_892813 [Schizopora paradoxa]|uniref:Uncharacterized protein n=1 Tax=Schizopora paradoxa TaxID=27342 RepID=A0A0H2RYD9_9AGAM|nr:hypothetical protein SCHPADRAFT_892813 [Schizopora paradoxa]
MERLGDPRGAARLSSSIAAIGRESGVKLVVKVKTSLPSMRAARLKTSSRGNMIDVSSTKRSELRMSYRKKRSLREEIGIEKWLTTETPGTRRWRMSLVIMEGMRIAEGNQVLVVRLCRRREAHSLLQPRKLPAASSYVKQLVVKLALGIVSFPETALVRRRTAWLSMGAACHSEESDEESADSTDFSSSPFLKQAVRIRDILLENGRMTLKRGTWRPRTLAEFKFVGRELRKGDFDADERAVGRTMISQHRKRLLDFALALGDNRVAPILWTLRRGSSSPQGTEYADRIEYEAQAIGIHVWFVSALRMSLSLGEGDLESFELRVYLEQYQLLLLMKRKSRTNGIEIVSDHASKYFSRRYLTMALSNRILKWRTEMRGKRILGSDRRGLVGVVKFGVFISRMANNNQYGERRTIKAQRACGHDDGAETLNDDGDQIVHLTNGEVEQSVHRMREAHWQPRVRRAWRSGYRDRPRALESGERSRRSEERWMMLEFEPRTRWAHADDLVRILRGKGKGGVHRGMGQKTLRCLDGGLGSWS